MLKFQLDKIIKRRITFLIILYYNLKILFMDRCLKFLAYIIIFHTYYNYNNLKNEIFVKNYSTCRITYSKINYL